MRIRLVFLALLAVVSVPAAVIEEVRSAIARNDLASAERQIQAYRTRKGVTPEVVEALSWLGRGALAARQYEAAERHARETRQLVLAELGKRPLDAERHLPIALGAAIEVTSQVLAARGERDQAVAYLREELRRYAATSIQPRIQKNIHLLSLEGKPAPAIDMERYVGEKKPPALAALVGKPAVLFFWAHWCGDCKGMVASLARLEQEYAGRFHLIGPTQHYGYVADGEEAGPAAETSYIEAVRRRFYAPLAGMPVPLSARAFRSYGCSTTPTIVLVDRRGIVRLYHPSGMTYEELKSALDGVLKR